MNTISRTSACIALTLLTGCAAFHSSPPPESTPVSTATCPVCPEPEQVVLQCPEPQVVEKVVMVTPPTPVPSPPPKPASAGKMNLPIVGAVEWATVEPGDIRMEARIDTGAETSSIHAEDIRLLEKDGKRWVHFSLLDPSSGEKVELEQRLRKTIRVKQSDSESSKRYVVRLRVTIGKVRSLIDVTLSDRDHMDYPLLIGRNMLVDTMIVDVSHSHLLK